MADEDRDYTDRVRAMPCAAAGMGGTACTGAVQAHHRITGRVARMPVKGGDRRAHDHDTIPLCLGHHDAWHGCRQPFRVFTKVERENWEDAQVFKTQKRLGLIK